MLLIDNKETASRTCLHPVSVTGSNIGHDLQIQTKLWQSSPPAFDMHWMSLPVFRYHILIG